MSIFITIVSILQLFSISLGVGSSTLAIVNFFVAIADGKIDETERKMMGVVYTVLRVCMVLILSTTILLILAQSLTNTLPDFTGFTLGMLLALAILFANAVLMTLHIMPSTFGPAIQAGSWYTLGMLMSLKTLSVTDFSFGIFLMAYITWLVFAVSLVNGIMAYLNASRHGFIKK